MKFASKICGSETPPLIFLSAGTDQAPPSKFWTNAVTLKSLNPCDALLPAVKANKVSCISSGCHEVVHDVGRGSLRAGKMGSVAALLRRWSPGDRQQRCGTIVACCGSGQKSCTARNYAQVHGLDSQDSKYAGGARADSTTDELRIIKLRSSRGR